MVDLRQHTRQVVDPVETQVAQNQVERARLKGQALLIVQNLPCDIQLVIEWQVRIAVQLGLRRLRRYKLGNARRERWRGRLGGVGVGVVADEGASDVACVGTEVEDAWEVSLDILRGKRKTTGVSLLDGQDRVDKHQGHTYQQSLAETNGHLVLEVVSLAASFDVGGGLLLLQPFRLAVEDLKDGCSGGLERVATASQSCKPRDRSGMDSA